MTIHSIIFTEIQELISSEEVWEQQHPPLKHTVACIRYLIDADGCADLSSEEVTVVELLPRKGDDEHRVAIRTLRVLLDDYGDRLTIVDLESAESEGLKALDAYDDWFTPLVGVVRI